MNEQNSNILTDSIPEIPAKTISQAEPKEIPADSNPMFRESATATTRKAIPIHGPSLVCGILSIIGWLFIVLVGEILGIVGICLAAKNRYEYNTTAGLVCSIIGLSLSVLTHIINVVLLLGS